MALNTFANGDVLDAADLNSNFTSNQQVMFSPVTSFAASPDIGGTTSTDWVLLETVDIATSDLVVGGVTINFVGAFIGGSQIPVASYIRLSVDDVSILDTGLGSGQVFPIAVSSALISTSTSHTVKIYLKKTAANSYSAYGSYSINTY